jgi:hypothetical protein
MYDCIRGGPSWPLHRDHSDLLCLIYSTLYNCCVSVHLCPIDRAGPYIRICLFLIFILTLVDDLCCSWLIYRILCLELVSGDRTCCIDWRNLWSSWATGGFSRMIWLITLVSCISIALFRTCHECWSNAYKLIIILRHLTNWWTWHERLSDEMLYQAR